MSCERYLDLISARMDGELTLLEQSQLSAHLRECPKCRAIAEDLEEIHSSFSQIGSIPAPDALEFRVMEQIREEQKTQRIAARQRRRTIRQLAGLAACLVLCVGVFQLNLFGKGNTGRTNLTDETLTPAAVGAKELVQSAYAVGSADTAASPPAQSDPSHYAFCNDRYIRVSTQSTAVVPSARILGSAQSLNEFLALFPDTLSDVSKKYTEDYFKTSRLLAVVLEEPSGSIRHQLAPQGLMSDSVTVIRQVPEVGTCDMAAWLILAEVDSMFEDGQSLKVVVTTVDSARP